MNNVNEDAQLEQIEISMKQARKSIDRMKSLEKLTNNKEFINIVLEGYFEGEASRLVLLKADPALQSVEDQKQLDNSITAIGYLRQYFITVNQVGRMSEKSLDADQETQEELLAGVE